MRYIFLLVFFVFGTIGCVSSPKLEETLVFYPPLPQQPRLQYLMTINSEDDIRDTGSAFMEFLLGDMYSEKRLLKPYDISSSSGKIYVLDRGYKKLLVVDLAERELRYINDYGMGTFQDPSGIWVSEDDIKYVTDMKRKQVLVFGPDDTYQGAYGGKGMFDKPVDVAVYGDMVYVCDMNKNQILVLDRDSGILKMTFSSLGDGGRRLHKPSHISIDRAGHIYVNDAFNYQIQKFDKEGKHLQSYGFHGDVVGAFARPKGLDIDREHNMYVIDSAYENAQIFDVESGRLLLFFGGSGDNPGNMYLPASVHIDYANAPYYKNFADEKFEIEYVVYVGNMFGASKLNVYGYGQWSGPYLEDRPK